MTRPRVRSGGNPARPGRYLTPPTRGSYIQVMTLSLTPHELAAIIEASILATFSQAPPDLEAAARAAANNAAQVLSILGDES